jgi:hypothetical protein
MRNSFDFWQVSFYKTHAPFLMKKIILCLFFGLSTAYAAQAQAVLVNGIGAGIGFGRMMMHRKAGDKAAKKADKNDNTSAYQGREFPMQRTPANQLPKKGAEQIVALETELERCHAAMLASPTGVISTPEQRAAMQAAIVNLAQAQSSRNLPDYQEEASFYLAEDARRQQAAISAPAPAPAAPTN